MESISINNVFSFDQVIIGTIERVYDDDKIDLSISENVIVKVVKSTVQQHASTKTDTKKQFFLCYISQKPN